MNNILELKRTYQDNRRGNFNLRRHHFLGYDVLATPANLLLRGYHMLGQRFGKGLT